MADFIPRMWDDNAVTTYLKRYSDCLREIAVAKKRLERLEYQAGRDRRYATGEIQRAIDEDRQRISGRILTAETVKSEVLKMLGRLPDGDERKALELYYVAGLTVAEIAETMFCSERTVFNLKERGVKLLIDFTTGEGEYAAKRENLQQGT